MTSPEISILIPYKNAADWISECLISIQNQSFADWEVIGINDASADESEVIFQQFQKNDPRFKSFKNPGIGIIPALEFGLLQSQGKYISRMDSDDMMPVKRLEQMRNALLKSGEKTVVTGLVRYFSDQPVTDGYQAYERWINQINLSGVQFENIYRECVIASPNWMTRREVLDSIGGFAELRYPEDYDLVFRWYAYGVDFVVVPEVTLLWREHPKRTSRNSKNYSQSAFFDLKIGAFLRLDFRGDQLIIWGKNKKSRLISRILREKGIPFENHDQEEFKKVNEVRNPQVLIAVYPSENERKAIQIYLQSLNLQEGLDWWWV